jgi:hypothetical protein
MSWQAPANVVQCKAHKGRIPIGVARELCASMADFGAHDAIIACFEGVTQPVIKYIMNKPIQVLDLGDIVVLQAKYDLVPTAITVG